MGPKFGHATNQLYILSTLTYIPGSLEKGKLIIRTVFEVFYFEMFCQIYFIIFYLNYKQEVYELASMLKV